MMAASSKSQRWPLLVSKQAKVVEVAATTALISIFVQTGGPH